MITKMKYFDIPVYIIHVLYRIKNYYIYGHHYCVHLIHQFALRLFYQ